MRRLAYFLFASLTLATGCLEDAPGKPDKGQEDDVPSDGKADSFRAPTEHGVLSFGHPSSTAFTDDEGFHSWTFKLTGSGRVDLRTDFSTPNLDTVIYLYKKSGSSWGSYIATNDDAADDTTKSRINKQLSAGEYRVIVKAYKRTQRGAFELSGACTGAGCPVVEACEPAAPMPAITGYSASCGPKFAAVLETGNIVSSAYREWIAYSARCDGLSALERRAMDYYAEYFGVNLDDEADELYLNVESYALEATSATGGGTLVEVDDGGDESTMRFLFDHAGELLVYYQDNQSPDFELFCGTGPEIELPNVEECISGLTSSVIHGTAVERALSLTAAPNNLPAGTQSEVRAAFNRYQVKFNTSAATKLTASGQTWDQYGDVAGIFSLTAPGTPATRYVVGRDLVLLEAPTGGPAELVCE